MQDFVSNTPGYGHITSHTIFMNNGPTILDLVFTNEELMIEKVVIDIPQCCSAHAVMHFIYICYAE